MFFSCDAALHSRMGKMAVALPLPKLSQKHAPPRACTAIGTRPEDLALPTDARTHALLWVRVRLDAAALLSALQASRGADGSKMAS